MKGLTTEEVNERVVTGMVNYDTTIETKSVKEIFKTNIFTLFNFINIFFGALVFFVGSYKNLLFLGTILCNTTIGIIQELQSKKIIDRLSLIASKKITVIRNGKEEYISVNEVVLNDTLKLEMGNQIVTDSKIVDGVVEVNESLITGEFDSIKKQTGDVIFSGSFIVSGSCFAEVIHVGTDNYTYKISKDAKYIKPITSEIMVSLKKIIKLISYVIIPIGVIFFLSQIHIPTNSLQSAVVNTVAALIAIIPDGLMLLTSTVMALSVIKLSRYKVLVQQLYCIENLARVDTICFDKTGTLTKGSMQIIDFVKFKDIDDQILSEICYNLDNHNATMNALVDFFGKSNNIGAKSVIPFSSEKKYSGVTLNNNKTYIIGAPEFILNNISSQVKKKINEYDSLNRVILLASSNFEFNGDSLPKNIEPLGLILVQDEIRLEATNTINFFEQNDVDVKIISGDNPKTVSMIAKRLGLKFADNYLDTTNLTNKQLMDAAEKYSIFGRVTPQGKKILIEALQKNNHTVAMTGDGVNDVLALKQSDCAIAVANGADAARNVAELVLLDSNFDSIPKIVREGRRTINNIERSASLFITKTLYAMLLLVLFLFVDYAYPFIPIQLTLTSTFTIGIPSFILALEFNDDRVRKGFLLNVMSVAFPTAITIVFNIILLLITVNITNIPYQDASTLAVLLLATTGFMHIYRISYPLNLIRRTLLITMIVAFLIAVFGFKGLFSLSIITNVLTAIYLILALFSYLFFSIITKFFEKYVYKTKIKRGRI